MARHFVINGRFLTQPITGVQRYARELGRAFDRLLEADAGVRDRFQFEIVAPSTAPATGGLTHIPTRLVGSRGGHLWEQWELPRHARSATIINLTNTGSLRSRNQIVTIHDASVFAAPGGYSWPFKLWYRTMHRQLCRRALRIVTDSHFSQSELVRHCNLDINRSIVIPLGGDHIATMSADDSVLDRHQLAAGKFVLVAGSLNPNKNLAALGGTARRLDELGFPMVVAGGGNRRVFQSADLQFPKSAKFLGYVNDSELRSLYQNARCFVFPSKYEGFGLPPLEAMACGCPVVCSNAASLPEICGDATLMVNPNDPSDIASQVMRLAQDDSLCADLADRGRRQASRFTWANAARAWLTLLESIT